MQIFYLNAHFKDVHKKAEIQVNEKSSHVQLRL